VSSRLGPVSGTVKWWKSEKGYGVVLTPDTAPKGIWVSFSHIDAEGYRELIEGEVVEIEYEPAIQDSFRFRATRVIRNRRT
jgi:CspA family cold shock protein